MYPFERFTDRAKKVLTIAQEEAERAGRTYIETEHLLLAILAEGEGIAAKVLGRLGMELDATRGAVGRLDAAAAAAAAVPQPPIPTSRVKRVVEMAFDESQRMGHTYVGTEHLLIGLVAEAEGVAARVLADAGVTIERVRDEVKLLLASGLIEAAMSGPPAAGPWPLRQGAALGSLLRRVQAEAVGRGARTAGLEDLLAAMSDAAGLGAVERLLEVRRARAAKEQAIAAQDYESAAGHRQAEQAAKAALRRALGEWERELEPPAAS